MTLFEFENYLKEKYEKAGCKDIHDLITAYNKLSLRCITCGDDNQNWISISEKQPIKNQDVAFIVDFPIDDSYDKRILGGKYRGVRLSGTKREYHAFSVPGTEFAASHWMPLPELPKGLE